MQRVGGFVACTGLGCDQAAALWPASEMERCWDPVRLHLERAGACVGLPPSARFEREQHWRHVHLVRGRHGCGRDPVCGRPGRGRLARSALTPLLGQIECSGRGVGAMLEPMMLTPDWPCKRASERARFVSTSVRALRCESRLSSALARSVSRAHTQPSRNGGLWQAMRAGYILQGSLIAGGQRSDCGHCNSRRGPARRVEHYREGPSEVGYRPVVRA